MGKQPEEPVSYTNRKGQTYYLHEIVRKTGKRGYAMKVTKEGALTELPEGMVIMESVHGTVSVGKPKPRKITDEEEEARFVDTLKRLGLNRYKCEVKDVFITVYEPLRSESDLRELVMRLGGIAPLSASSSVEKLVATSRVDAVMRFKVMDKQKRLFMVERMTYGGEGGWWSLERGKPLLGLANKYLPHLGKESFFDLI